MMLRLLAPVFFLLGFASLSWGVLPVELQPGKDSLSLTFPNLKLSSPSKLLILATSSGPNGSAFVPFAQNKTGSTLFLPFQADHLLLIRSSGMELTVSLRAFNGFGLKPAEENPAGVKVTATSSGSLSLQIPRAWAGTNSSLQMVAALKDLSANQGWGTVLDSTDPYLINGQDDRYLTHALSFPLSESNITDCP